MKSNKHKVQPFTRTRTRTKDKTLSRNFDSPHVVVVASTRSAVSRSALVRESAQCACSLGCCARRSDVVGVGAAAAGCWRGGRAQLRLVGVGQLGVGASPHARVRRLDEQVEQAARRSRRVGVHAGLDSGRRRVRISLDTRGRLPWQHSPSVRVCAWSERASSAVSWWAVRRCAVRCGAAVLMRPTMRISRAARLRQRRCWWALCGRRKTFVFFLQISNGTFFRVSSCRCARIRAARSSGSTAATTC